MPKFDNLVEMGNFHERLKHQQLTKETEWHHIH